MKDLRYLAVFVLMALLLAACGIPTATAPAAPTRVAVQGNAPATTVAIIAPAAPATKAATAAPTARPTKVATAMPTMPPTQTPMPVPTMQPAQAVTNDEPPATPPKRLVLPGVKINSAVRPEVLDRWYALSFAFPDVAQRIKRIEVRSAGSRAWKVSYEQTVIYLNNDYGVYVQIDMLTQAFAKKAFAYLQRYKPAAAREVGTWQKLAETLVKTVGVR